MSVKCWGQRNTALNSQSQSQLSTSAQGQPLEDKNLVCRACLDTRRPFQVYELLFFVLAVLLKNIKSAFLRVAQQPTQNTHYKARARNRFLAILQWTPVRSFSIATRRRTAWTLPASNQHSRFQISLQSRRGLVLPHPGWDTKRLIYFLFPFGNLGAAHSYLLIYGGSDCHWRFGPLQFKDVGGKTC